MNAADPRAKSALLGLFGDVRVGEATRVTVLAATLFLTLVAYYILKTLREPLILVGGGAEVKSYAAAGQAMVLMAFVPAYGALAARVARLRLIVGVVGFFVACIQLFVLGWLLSVPFLGVFFYVWVGIFSLAIIAQFWSLANDIYSKHEGERLFPVIAIGANAGSIVGSKIASWLFEREVGTVVLLQVPALLLVVTVLAYVWILRLAPAQGHSDPQEKIVGPTGFSLVLSRPYLRWIALVFILLNLVNTTGEYILGSMVLDAAHNQAANGIEPSSYIGAFYADYFFWVNTGTVIIQALVVSRLVRFGGMGAVLFALPVVAAGAYTLVAAGIGLAAVRIAKSAENMTDYSIMNTAKAMMWLPTSRDEKYKAKQAIDTFFVRFGDVLSAGFVWMGTQKLGWSLQSFAAANLVVIALWALGAERIRRRYGALAEEAKSSAHG